MQNYLLLRSVVEENVRADGDLNKRRIYDFKRAILCPTSSVHRQKK